MAGLRVSAHLLFQKARRAVSLPLVHLALWDCKPGGHPAPLWPHHGRACVPSVLGTDPGTAGSLPTLFFPPSLSPFLSSSTNAQASGSSSWPWGPSQAGGGGSSLSASGFALVRCSATCLPCLTSLSPCRRARWTPSPFLVRRHPLRLSRVEYFAAVSKVDTRIWTRRVAL